MTFTQRVRLPWALQSRDLAETEIVGTYDDALTRALTLAPRFRGERTICDSLPPVPDRPFLPASARLVVRAVAVLATILAAILFSSWDSIAAVMLAAAFGLAAAASGDRLGAASRGVVVRTGWAARAAPAVTVAVEVILVVVLTISALLISGGAAAGVLFAALAMIAAVAGFASRVGDAEIEACVAARETARGRRETTEHAVHRAIDALRTAHAADLARIAAEMGYPQTDGGDHAAIDVPETQPRMSVGA